MWQYFIGLNNRGTMERYCKGEVFFKAVSQSALAATFISGLIFRVRSSLLFGIQAKFSQKPENRPHSCTRFGYRLEKYLTLAKS